MTSDRINHHSAALLDKFELALFHIKITSDKVAYRSYGK